MVNNPTGSIKKSGPIHLVYSGKQHIGNIIAPTLGGNRESAQHWIAISKFWGLKKNHDSKTDALQWLKQQHGEPMQMENISNPAVHVHCYVNSNGKTGNIVHTIKEWQHEYYSFPDPNHKLVGPFPIVEHSSMDKAHQRMIGLGYKPIGETDVYIEELNESKNLIEKKKPTSNYSFSTNLALTPKGMVKEEQWKYNILNQLKENIDNYREKTSKLSPKELNDHYHGLYQSHIKTGMAPKYFKSPLHLAQIDERNQGLPKGTYSKYVIEEPNWQWGNAAEPEMDTIGQTGHSLGMHKKKLKIKRILNKAYMQDKDSAPGVLDNIIAGVKVSEELFDKDVNRKDPKAGPQPKENPLGDTEFQIKRTMTGKPGDVISINPKMKMKKSGADFNAGSDSEHKSKPSNNG